MVTHPHDADAPVDSASEWRAKLTELSRASDGSATLDLSADFPTSSFLELLGAAQVGFDAIDIARGKTVLHLSGPPIVTTAPELLVTLRTDAFFVEVSRPDPAAGLSRQSDVVEHVGQQLQDFLSSMWLDAPCDLTILAKEDVSFFAVVDAVVGVSTARPCVSSFSFGWSGAQREPRRSPASGRRLLTLRVPLPPASAPPKPALHEERDVRVDNVVEHWRIQWRDDPGVVCLAWDCPCSQFMFGQRGQVDLVRTRPGAPDDVFPLEQLFDGHNDLPTHGLNESILRTWQAQAGDEPASGVSETVVRARPHVTVMDLHDYDRDGRATEFALPVGGGGCAYHHYVAVGISRAQPKLHVLGTAAHPAAPLELSWAGWDLLRKGRGGTYVDMECGFRGADEQLEITLRADAASIHGSWVRYACPRADGRVIEKRAF
jgi:hypothetical protein